MRASTAADTDHRVVAYLPDGLDLAPLVPHDYHDHAAFIVTALTLRPHLDQKHRKGEAVPLSSALLRRLVGHAAPRVIALLVQGEVIERVSDYHRGTPGSPGRCRTYRLTRRHAAQPVRAVPLTHRELVGAVAGWRRDARERLSLPVHRWLHDWLTQVEVRPDAPGDQAPLAAIRDGQRWFVVCRQGRVHTNVSNLKRGFRRFLRVGDGELWANDVRNSQPLLLGLTLRGIPDDGILQDFGEYTRLLARHADHFLSGGGEIQLDNPEGGAGGGPPRGRGSAGRGGREREEAADPRPHLVGYSGAGPIDGLDRYIETCRRGEFYDAVMDEVRDLYPGYSPTRDTVKQRVLAVLYGQPEHAGTKIGRALDRAFPGVMAAVRESNGREHGGLARAMQTLESYLVIGRVADRLRREHPAVPLLTVHDSLVTDRAHIEPYTAVLKDEFERVLGVVPTVTTKPFGPVD